MELTYEPVEGVERVEYGRHYSVSRIVDGEMEMVFLGIGREGRRFGLTNDLPEGDYLLASGNRLSDGSTPVTVTLFHVTPGESLQVPVLIETVLEAVEVQGHFDASALPVSEGNYAAAILDVGMEPTNHVLHDIAEEKAELEAWGCPIVLIATSEAQLERLHSEIDEGRYGILPTTVVFVLDQDGTLLDRAISSLEVSAGRLPIVFVGNVSTKEVYFVSQGYTIGMGAKIAALARKL